MRLTNQKFDSSLKMSTLAGKKIVLGITGSIAAYKAAHLTRLLIKEGAEVKVVMTTSASAFISPLTLSTLSKHPVDTEIISEESWNNHVELGLWGDLIVVAPATANTLAKMASGICDNLLLATLLSSKCPVCVAPAMDLDMWRHPATQRNLDLLEKDGVKIIPVGHGELASGLFGDGRMAEPEDIVSMISQLLSQEALEKSALLSQKRVLVTAGPTHEAIDPVRFIGNRSSGKMGIAIVKSLLESGAQVDLVIGPVTETVPDDPSLTVYRVQTAEEMLHACALCYPHVDAAVFAAAVGDYRVDQILQDKLKREKDKDFQMVLVPNPDIAAHFGNIKRLGVVHIGFALETSGDKLAYAQGKLTRKNFDCIVLNSPGKNTGFGVETNEVTLCDTADQIEHLPLMPKQQVANHIIQKLAHLLSAL
jgi:phosphopantothenoylcysteine decarboxylase/phosphopantothenate--cysteine ligase